MYLVMEIAYFLHSYIVTGSKRQHAQMRAVIVRNMPFFENELMRNVINGSVYRNIDHYLSVTRMYCDGAWGGDPEIQTLAVWGGIPTK